jgi:hypothetical protein
MLELIRRLGHWVGLLFGPGVGVHRAGGRRAACPAAGAVLPADSLRLPPHRSPYCLHLPLDGGDSRLVRPYLAAYERERARHRCLRGVTVDAFGLGIDLGNSVLGAEAVAA